MPYFPGFNFTDGNGNPITNSGGTAYMREPHASIASIAGGLANLGNLVGPAGVGGAVEDLATTIGAPQETATIAGDIAAVATALAPVAVAILAPEVGLAAVAFEVLNAAGALHQLYNGTAPGSPSQAWGDINDLGVPNWPEGTPLPDTILGRFFGAFEIIFAAANSASAQAQHNHGDIATVQADVVLAQQYILDTYSWLLANVGRRRDYPGPSFVTAGTPVVVTESTLVDGPMDGALLDWTATPPGAGGRGAGGNVSYYHLGFYTFISTDGYAEDLRYLSWNTHVLTPRSILHPAKLLLYLEKPGCSVTVQPWSLA